MGLTITNRTFVGRIGYPTAKVQPLDRSRIATPEDVLGHSGA